LPGSKAIVHRGRRDQVDIRLTTPIRALFRACPAAFEFVGEFGEFAAAGHFAGEFFEGDLVAGFVQDAAAQA